MMVHSDGVRGRRRLGGGLYRQLVGEVETEMAQREKEGCRHPLRTRGMEVVERKECKIISE